MKHWALRAARGTVLGVLAEIAARGANTIFFILLARHLESDAGAGQRAAEAARAAESQSKDQPKDVARDGSREQRDRLASLAFKDPARLSPARSVSCARAWLPTQKG